MDGICKKIVFVFLFLTVLGCKKEEKPISKNEILISEARNLIRQNSNVLLDSIIQFDIRLPNEKNDPPKFTIGLIDSIPKREMKQYLGRMDGDKFTSFKLEKSDLVNFKSPYKLNLVKTNNNDINVLFITFSEVNIDGNHAYVVVKKVRGIGMITNTYYFRKENGKWVFTKKEVDNMG